MKICSQCGTEYKIRQIIDGKKHVLKNRTKCLACQPFKSSIYRKKTPEEKRAKNARKVREHWHRTRDKLGVDPIRLRRESYKKAALALIGSKCQFCNYNKCVRNLAFHHLANKSFDLSSRAFQFSLDKLIDELRKCVIACHNCHGEIHEGLIDKQVVVDANTQLMSALEAWHGKEWSDIVDWKANLNV